MKIGLVSDTHGRFDPGLRPLFDGCDLVLHAGDVVGREILALLASVAPVTAVRGNNDLGDYGSGLPGEAVLQLEGLRTLVIHQLGIPQRPSPLARRAMERARPDLVVFGHSHRPTIEVANGILFINPGSAGPRRFRLPRTAAVLTVAGRKARVEVFDLDRADRPMFRLPVEVTL
ncbi:MAG TPA: metallophosphoesterase [Myxococcales bacterium]|jgi:hypothetical protein|nr:metallophosphoesterase [Myxococcales bacterium]